MPKNASRYHESGQYALVTVSRLPTGATEIKTYGPYAYMEKALSERGKLLSGNSLLTSQYLRKQAQVYIVPMLIWSAKDEKSYG